MIGSLWDLKRCANSSDCALVNYHDRFPMGFETLHYCCIILTVIYPIMIGSLWDLKHVVLNDISVNIPIMIGSLWDLKPFSAYSSSHPLSYHDRFPMGFETRWCW